MIPTQNANKRNNRFANKSRYKADYFRYNV